MNRSQRYQSKNKRSIFSSKVYLVIILILFSIIVYLLVNQNKVKHKQQVRDDKVEERGSSKKNNTETLSSSTVKEIPQSDTPPFPVSGTWIAYGSVDKKWSSWQFKDTSLIINGNETLSYVVLDTLDKKGYTVIVITNNQSKEHALLIKESEVGFEGITVEGDDYLIYKKSGDIPSDQESIIFQSDPSEVNNTVSIANAFEATEYLLGELDAEDDIRGSGEEQVTEMEIDERGRFYTIRLVSLSMVKAGGSGTIGRFKVYVDGFYEQIS